MLHFKHRDGIFFNRQYAVISILTPRPNPKFPSHAKAYCWRKSSVFIGPLVLTNVTDTIFQILFDPGAQLISPDILI